MNRTLKSNGWLSLGALALCLCAAPTLAGAQQAASKLNVEGNKKLLSEAKINPDSAAAIATAKVPGTSASTAKIEREGKSLVYSVSLLKPGSKGVDRVWVDANTGTVTKTKHYGGVSGRMRHSHQAHEAKEAAKAKS
jgi:Peptidase propeptide and YPEB domain